VLAYAASPTEKRIVFDRPIDPARFKNLARQTELTMGRYVVAGERFEAFRPGYQAVVDQRAVPRFTLPVLSAGITPGNRTIVLQTTPETAAVNYAIKLPADLHSNRTNDASRHELPQYDALDIVSDLTGVEASWRAQKKSVTNWFGWLPHLNLDVARAFTAASAEHARLFELLKQPGTLELRAQLDLWSMLHPAIQPGAKLAYTYPPEIVTVILKSRAALKINDTNFVRVNSHEFRVTLTSAQYQWLPLDITLPTGKGGADLEISWFTDEDPRPRAFPLRRILLPWAKPESSATLAVGPRVIPQIAGGDWERGRQVFFGEKAACSRCHQVGGQGGRIGPDLSSLFYRDYDSVLRDITQPSAAINPDHVAYNVQLRDGDSVTGVIMETTATTVVLGQATGQNLTLQKSEIQSMKASSLSLMPEGLLQGLSAQQQKDLLTFLLTAKP
jgi:putative heme-binding domain-containing protein